MAAAKPLRIRRAWPIPEIIKRGDAPEHWKVHQVRPDRHATTDIAAGHMDVPLDGEDDGAAWTRRHEMAHVKWSPAAIPGEGEAWQPWVFATEDARVNLLLKRHKFDVATGYHGDSVVASQPRLADQVAVAVATFGTDAERAAWRYVTSADKNVGKALARVRTIITRNPKDPAVAVEAAKFLASIWKRPPTPPGGACKGGGGGKGSDADDPRTGGYLTREGMVWTTAELSALGIPMDGGKPLPPSLFVSRHSDRQWGALTIQRPELPVPLPKLNAHGKRRPSDTGAFPRRMERWATDQAVFATRGRQRGGTILLDGSGSMSLSPTQIEDCLKGAPAAMVAVYSGSRMKGTLTILAQRGKRVRVIPDRDAGNVVDGPALRWLVEQRAPRVWVSDGGITGASPNGEVSASAAMYREVAELCMAFRVRRTKQIAKAAELLRGDYHGD